MNRMVMRATALALMSSFSIASAAHGQIAGSRIQAIEPSQLHLGEPMAQLSAAEVRREVQASPLYVGRADLQALMRAEVTDISLSPGLELNLSAYLRRTRIAAQPTAGVAINAPQALGLQSRPEVTEEVFVLEDRLVVSREVTITVTADTCGTIQRLPTDLEARPQASQSTAVELARSELCFRPPNPERSARLSRETQPVLLDPEAELTGRDRPRLGVGPGGSRLMLPPSETDIAAEAESLRSELRRRPSGEIFRHGVTVRQALRLPDAALIRLDADGETRVINHVSIIPLARGVEPPDNLSRRLPDAALPNPQGGFNEPFGPRIDQLPPGLAPYVRTRNGARPNFTPQLQLPRGGLDLATPRQPDPDFQIQGLQPPPGGFRPDVDTDVLLERREYQVQRINQSRRFTFVTGFTLTDEIEERHKVTFNKRRNFFIAFKYRVGYRAGLRFPFHVDVESSAVYRTDVDTGRWEGRWLDYEVAVAGAPGNRRGVYADAGMARDLIFDDREMTFGVWAWCQLQVRLPVIKTVRVNCPSISVPRQGRCPNWACSDFKPPIGGRQRIADPRIPARVSGLQINAWVARAGVEPGVNIYANRPTLTLRAAPEGGARFERGRGQREHCTRLNGWLGEVNELDGETCLLTFDRVDDDGMARLTGTFRTKDYARAAPGLILSDPVYSFEMQFVPVLELFAELDVAVASWRVDKEIEIPGLTIKRDFRFDRHRGTTPEALIGGCSPDDDRAPGCAEREGYRFEPIRTQFTGQRG